MVESSWVPPTDGAPPSGGRPINGLLLLVGISDRVISNVVRVMWDIRIELPLRPYRYYRRALYGRSEE